MHKAFNRREKVSVWKNQEVNLLKYDNQKKNGSFDDVTIQVQNEQFRANGMVLSCYSEYFETMFDIEMIEKYQDAVDIKGFEGIPIEILIDYMYGEKIFINSDNTVQILSAADYLLLHEVKKFCMDFLQDGLTVNNWLEALNAYESYDPAASLNYVYHFVQRNFEAIYHQETLRHLSQSQLTSLLRTINKEVKQASLFAAITNWIGCDETNRNHCFTELFHLVNLEQVTYKILEETILFNNLVRQNQACLDAVITVVSTNIREAKLEENESKIICLTSDYTKNSKMTEVCDIFGRSVPESKYPNLPIQLFWHYAQKAGDFVYS